ncbi:MAG: diaminopimelate decarboxylase [Clostridiales bacterium]|jgi:diaminopimelate decarboxylase|nr:diaminopimelate decarboxylase [Clostridiales bacterium]
MIKLNGKVTDTLGFFEGNDPFSLIQMYSSPLYVYNERILRQRCRELTSMCFYPDFAVNYSAKANSSLAILQIARQEGLYADAMSPGEIYLERAAGFPKNKIFFVCNNVSGSEMNYAFFRQILISADSLSQLELFGSMHPGSRVAARLNCGIGTGHHEKVVTAGKKTKFGIDAELVPEMIAILEKYDLKLVGINQHIGSLFLEDSSYIDSVNALLSLAKDFPDLEFIDFGGGFGIPYEKQLDQGRLDLPKLGEKLDLIMYEFVKQYGREISFMIEPGRYVVAEAGVLLGTAHSVKKVGGTKYVGTDLGFNVLARPMLYDSHHDIEVYRKEDIPSWKTEAVTIVGNICESGDIIAKDRQLPEILENDLLGVLDAGAYGYSMSSSYNSRLRPAEVLIRRDGSAILIRKRDILEDLVKSQLSIEL